MFVSHGEGVQQIATKQFTWMIGQCERLVGRGEMITHAQYLLPVPPTPYIIKSEVTSTGAHLSSRQSGDVDVRPPLLNGLPMGTTNPFRIVKRVTCLT